MVLGFFGKFIAGKNASFIYFKNILSSKCIDDNKGYLVRSFSLAMVLFLKRIPTLTSHKITNTNI